MNLPTLGRQVLKRLMWEGYVQRMKAHHLMWDLLALGGRSREKGWELYSALKSPISNGDPILSAPGLDRKGVYTEGLPEYLCRIPGPATIEPGFGYVIRRPFHALDSSLPYSEMTRSRPHMVYFSGMPSLSALLLRRWRRKPVLRERAVVSMHHPFSGNYYHFIQDILTRIKLLDDHGIDPSVPLVVDAHLARQRFFQEITHRGELAKRRWLVQDGFFIDADEVIYARTAEGSRERLDYAMDLMDAPAADPNAARRIFLRRAPGRGRNVANWSEVSSVLDEFGFEAVDTGEMSAAEQMKLFSQTGYVIGIHGAGLTNTIFRRGQPMKLLEILTPGATLAYYLIARLYGYRYDYITGSNPGDKTRHSDFHLDPQFLRAKLSADLSRNAANSPE